jgi:hypothetical protein
MLRAIRTVQNQRIICSGIKGHPFQPLCIYELSMYERLLWDRILEVFCHFESLSWNEKKQKVQ